MPSLTKSEVCVACGGTGRDSRGGLCRPCLSNGRIAPELRRVLAIMPLGIQPEPPVPLPEQLVPARKRVDL